MEQAQERPQPSLRDEVAAAMRSVQGSMSSLELARELGVEPARVASAAGLDAEDRTTQLTPEQASAVRRRLARRGAPGGGGEV